MLVCLSFSVWNVFKTQHKNTNNGIALFCSNKMYFRKFVNMMEIIIITRIIIIIIVNLLFCFYYLVSLLAWKYCFPIKTVVRSDWLAPQHAKYNKSFFHRLHRFCLPNETKTFAYLRSKVYGERHQHRVATANQTYCVYYFTNFNRS